MIFRYPKDSQCENYGVVLPAVCEAFHLLLLYCQYLLKQSKQFLHLVETVKDFIGELRCYQTYSFLLNYYIKRLCKLTVDLVYHSVYLCMCDT